VIRSLDPWLMEETGDGLRVQGTLDLDESETARQAWRSMKADRVALSFGYFTTKSHERSGGVTELLELDLFEISVVPAAANPDTRFLSLKAIDEEEAEQLRGRAGEIACCRSRSHRRRRGLTSPSGSRASNAE